MNTTKHLKHLLSLAVLVLCGTLSAQTSTDSNDSALLDNYMKNTIASTHIVFDSSNIKQFWIDKSVFSQKDSFSILLLKSNSSVFESIPLKIQLANVDETMGCRVDVISRSKDFDYSITNSINMALATSSESSSFIDYNIISKTLSDSR